MPAVSVILLLVIWLASVFTSVIDEFEPDPVLLRSTLSVMVLVLPVSIRIPWLPFDPIKLFETISRAVALKYMPFRVLPVMMLSEITSWLAPLVNIP